MVEGTNGISGPDGNLEIWRKLRRPRASNEARLHRPTHVRSDAYGLRSAGLGPACKCRLDKAKSGDRLACNTELECVLEKNGGCDTWPQSRLIGAYPNRPCSQLCLDSRAALIALAGEDLAVPGQNRATLVPTIISPQNQPPRTSRPMSRRYDYPARDVWKRTRAWPA